MPNFNFDRPYNEKCDLCEHEKDKHWTVNINTGGLMNGPCKNGDEDNPCICDYFERKMPTKQVVLSTGQRSNMKIKFRFWFGKLTIEWVRIQK